MIKIQLCQYYINDWVAYESISSGGQISIGRSIGETQEKDVAASVASSNTISCQKLEVKHLFENISLI